jgi:dinuclear metal center YbgI/SA1388 family protein
MPSSVPLNDIVTYLDQYLRVRDVPDEENAINGLQVESVSGRVTRIVAAVDASLATILSAGAAEEPGRPAGATAEAGSPRTAEPSGHRLSVSEHTLLLVHHGLFWDGNIPLTGRRYRRAKALLDRDLALYAAHIPLDVHPEVGNNAVLARQLGVTGLAPFDTYRGISIGVQGTLEPAVPREEFASRIGKLLDCAVKLIPGGPALSRRVGVITGGAGNRIGAAREAGLDTYLTGEGAHHTYFDAMELGVNAIFAGHYATETVGVKALAAHLSQEFGIPWEFHDHPTGL